MPKSTLRKTITLEVETHAPVSVLRAKSAWIDALVLGPDGQRYELEVLQVQADAIQAAPKPKRGSRKP